MKSRRVLLGRFPLDAQVSSSIDDTGLLTLVFERGARPDASLVSLDGSRAVASMLPSGRLAALLVQDATDAEGTRRVPFAFGVVELVNDGATLTVFLEPGATR